MLSFSGSYSVVLPMKRPETGIMIGGYPEKFGEK
jgi:hypothetical protein